MVHFFKKKPMSWNLAWLGIGGNAPRIGKRKLEIKKTHTLQRVFNLQLGDEEDVDSSESNCRTQYASVTRKFISDKVPGRFYLYFIQETGIKGFYVVFSTNFCWNLECFVKIWWKQIQDRWKLILFPLSNGKKQQNASLWIYLVVVYISRLDSGLMMSCAFGDLQFDKTEVFPDTLFSIKKGLNFKNAKFFLKLLRVYSSGLHHSEKILLTNIYMLNLHESFNLSGVKDVI